MKASKLCWCQFQFWRNQSPALQYSDNEWKVCIRCWCQQSTQDTDQISRSTLSVSSAPVTVNNTLSSSQSAYCHRLGQICVIVESGVQLGACRNIILTVLLTLYPCGDHIQFYSKNQSHLNLAVFFLSKTINSPISVPLSPCGIYSLTDISVIITRNMQEVKF